MDLDTSTVRRTRVCIYGGTNLQESCLQDKTVPFVSTLARRILESMPARIVTGGFLKAGKNPEATSTDAAALDGARKFAGNNTALLKECFEAWVPQLDGRPDVGGVIRMSEESGVTVRVLAGRTPLGRRLAMVAEVDMLVTISGHVHTEVVVEQALELGIPVLPIPDAGGDSWEMLEKHRDRIAAYFAPGALEKCLGVVSHTVGDHPEMAADAVIRLLRTAKVGKCLVLLPFDVAHDDLYKMTLEPAVAEHMLPVRLDRLPASAAIYTSFADAVRTASAIVADITTINKNVMYEIGYAHGCGLTPLIYTRDRKRVDDLPVYFRTLNVKVAKEAPDVAQLVGSYLKDVKSRRFGQSAID